MSLIPLGGVSNVGALPLIGGVPLPFADGRYVKRFVGSTLAADTETYIAADGTTQVRFRAPTTIHAGVPLDAHQSLMNTPTGSSGLFVDNSSIIGAATQSTLSMRRFNGTWPVPTGVLSGEDVGRIVGNAYGSDGLFSFGQEIRFTMRENAAAATRGGLVRVRATAVGSSTQRDIASFQCQSSTVAEILFGLSDGRLRPNTTLGIRNPLDTAFVLRTGADTLGLFNVTPAARQTITGSRGGNAALADLLTKGALNGYWIDSTTA